MIKIKELTKNKIVVFGLLIVVISISLNIPYLSLLYTFVVCGISIKLPTKLEKSIIFRAVLSIIIILTIFQTETSVFYLIRLRINALSLNAITLIIFIFYAYLRHIDFSTLKLLKLNMYDFKILIAPIVLITVIIGGILNLNRGVATSVLSSFLYASDNGAHIEMFSLNVRNEGNLFKTDYKLVDNDDDFAYPMGWHNATAIVFNSFILDSKNISFMNIVYGYFIAFLLTLFLSFISLSYFIYSFYLKHTKDNSSLIKIVILPVIVGFIGFLAIFPVYKMGFFNFIPIFIYVLLSAAIILNVDNEREITSALAIILLMSCGVVCSWLLPFPIFICMAAIILLHLILRKKVKDAILISVISMCVLAVAFITVKKTIVGNISVNSLSNGGGLPSTFDDTFIILSVIVGFIYIIKNYVYRKEKQNYFSIFLFCNLLILGILRAYFIIKGYGLSYYYIKFSYIASILCVPILMVSIVLFVEKYQKRVFVSIPVLIVIVLFLGTYGNNLSYIDHWTKYINTSKYLSDGVANVIKDEYKNPYNVNVRYIYPVYNNEPGIAEIFVRLININKYTATNKKCVNLMSSNRGSLADSLNVLQKNNCPGEILSIEDATIYE